MLHIFLSNQPGDVQVGSVVFIASKISGVSYDISGPLIGTGCTISGMASVPPQTVSDGNLIINFLLPKSGVTNAPPDRMAIGSGLTTIPAVSSTITCPGNPPETTTSDREVHWLSLPSLGVPVSADGQIITGRWERIDSEGAKLSEWTFKAERER